MRTPANPLIWDLRAIMRHTTPIWNALRDARIFITGGTGFIGCWLLESFAFANDALDLNASAVVLTRDYSRFQKKAPHLANRDDIQFIVGDPLSFRFPSGPFTHVIHAAATEPERVTMANATYQAIRFAEEAQAATFMLISSGAVHGDANGALTEYGKGKQSSEALCYLRLVGGRVQIRVARCFTFVGPYLPLDRNFAIGNFIRDKIAGGPIIVEGDGTPIRSYLYAADMAAWLWTILIKGDTLHYNVGSSLGINIGCLAKEVSHVDGNPVPVFTRRVRDLTKWPERYVPDTSRSTVKLGLREWTPRKDAILKTIRWNKK